MRQFWARAVAAGVPEDLFWAATPGEVLEVLSAIRRRNEDQERLERERAGLIAAIMVNAWGREKGDRPVRPLDFWRDPDADRLSPDEALQFMRAWAEGQNRRTH